MVVYNSDSSTQSRGRGSEAQSHPGIHESLSQKKKQIKKTGKESARILLCSLGHLQTCSNLDTMVSGHFLLLPLENVFFYNGLGVGWFQLSF